VYLKFGTVSGFGCFGALVVILAMLLRLENCRFIIIIIIIINIIIII